MKKFFAILDSSRTAIPAAKRYVGVEGDEEFFAEYFNTLAYELNQVDYIIGTAAQVTTGAANVKIVTGSAFQDINGSTVTFVQGDRIAIIGHDALDANVSFTPNDLVFSMNPDVSINLASTYTLTISGTGARGNLNFTNAPDKSIIYGDSTSYLDIQTDNTASVKSSGSGIINGNHFDHDSAINDNLFLNSFKDHWQEGTSFTSIANDTYFADIWKYNKLGTNVASIVHNVTRITDPPTEAQSGVKIQYAARATYTGAGIPTLAADDLCIMTQFIPGYKIRLVADNTASFSIWVRASTTGVYCVSFRNSGADRSYVVELTVNSASTWEKKEVTFDVDTSSGTWDFENGTGLRISICLGSGINSHTTPNAWQTGSYSATANQVNALAAGSGSFDFCLDTLNYGPLAKIPESYSSEKDLDGIKAFYEKSTYEFVPGVASAAGSSAFVAANTVPTFYSRFQKTKRSAPTVTTWSTVTTTSGVVRNASAATDVSASVINIGRDGFTIQTGAVSTGQFIYFQWEADSRT